MVFLHLSTFFFKKYWTITTTPIKITIYAKFTITIKDDTMKHPFLIYLVSIFGGYILLGSATYGVFAGFLIHMLFLLYKLIGLLEDINKNLKS